MTDETFALLDLTVAPGSRAFTWLRVARLLTGAELRLPVHVVQGTRPGPVLGLTSAVHGIEHLPVRVLREALLRIAPADLRGTIVAVPVCNPLTFASRSRITLLEEDIDFANLNRVFPGVRPQPAFGSGDSHPSDRTLTEAIADNLVAHVLSRLTHLLDFHCHFSGAALAKVILGERLDGQQGRDSKMMALAFGTGLIHQHAMTPNTLAGQAERRGIAVATPEIGGGGLSETNEQKAIRMSVDGVFNVLASLGMVSGRPARYGRQMVFYHAPHVRPVHAGYLVSEFDPDRLFAGENLGVRVARGQVLGRTFDPYTFEELETLVAPVDGVLYLTRKSGPIEGGAHAFAVAATEGATWLQESV